MTRFVEVMRKAGEPLEFVEIPEGKTCPRCGRAARVHVSAAWLDRARILKRYVSSNRVVFVKDVTRELRRLRRELAWVAFNRRVEAHDAEEWEKALAWVRADRSGVEAELLDTLSLQIPPHGDETESDYVARLRAYRVALRRLGETDGVDVFTLLQSGEGGE